MKNWHLYGQFEGAFAANSSRRTTNSVQYCTCTATVINIHMASTNNQSAATIPRVGGTCGSWISNKRARWAKRTTRLCSVFLASKRVNIDKKQQSRRNKLQTAFRLLFLFFPRWRRQLSISLPLVGTSPRSARSLAVNNAWQSRGDSGASAQR